MGRPDRFYYLACGKEETLLERRDDRTGSDRKDGKEGKHRGKAETKDWMGLEDSGDDSRDSGGEEKGLWSCSCC